MKISIILSYHNRRPQFINTLRSMIVFDYSCELEMIVVNDASRPEHNIDDLPDKFPMLNMKVYNVDPNKKWWVNPCIPNNMAMRLATGDVFLLHNPECVHAGNVIKYAEENISRNKYIVFGCYAIDHVKTYQMNKINFEVSGQLSELLHPMSNIHVSKAPVNRWYQHPKYNPSALNFCSAITREDMEDLGGFDERFAEGIAKDDVEFRLRFRRKGMEELLLEDPFVVHQMHNQAAYGDRIKFERNAVLLRELESKPDVYKVHNKLTDKLITEVLY